MSPAGRREPIRLQTLNRSGGRQALKGSCAGVSFRRLPESSVSSALEYKPMAGKEAHSLGEVQFPDTGFRQYDDMIENMCLRLQGGWGLTRLQTP